ncbi:hypothetical protein EJ110_NYTH11737 [Nymphaea thermarum]|nr:hypothetical protein EJ110_NYTH11737 [Nymphaea thermarum]
MSSINRAVIAAGATAAVQGLKDQGIRFNSVMRVLHQNVRRNYASSTQLKRLSSSTIDSSSLLQREVGDERSKEAEESLRKVCWTCNPQGQTSLAPVTSLFASESLEQCHWVFFHLAAA